MSRIRRNQRRRMGVGLLIAGVALLVTVGVLVAGANLILGSNAGERVDNQGLEGPVRFLPESSTALIGVVDSNRRLTSVAVLSLSPDGTGGAIMPMSASADVGSGENDVLRPLAATVADSESGGDNFLKGAESISNIKFDRAELIDVARFEQLFASVGEIDVTLDTPVSDSDTGTNWNVGEQRLTMTEAGQLLTATNVYAQDYFYDAARYQVWRGIARASAPAAPATEATTPPTTPSSEAATPTSAAAQPGPAIAPPSNMDEFVQRLLAGPVVERGLGITAVEDQRVIAELDPDLADAFGTDGAPSVVVHNMSETAIVGSAVAPGRLGATRDGPNYLLVAAFTEEDLAGRDFTRADLVKEAVDRLSFSGVNLPSIVILDEPAQQETTLEVANPEDLEAARTQAADLDLGINIQAGVASEPIVGIDAEIRLGLSYLESVKGKLTDFDGPFTMELNSTEPLSMSPAAVAGTIAPKQEQPTEDSDPAADAAETEGTATSDEAVANDDATDDATDDGG